MPKHLLLDSNLSILLVVGVTDRKYIQKHKRLAAFDATDYDLLTNLIGASAGLVFSPNVLTETSNLIRHVAEPIRTEIAATLSTIIGWAKEHHVASRDAVQRSEYLRLGLADAVTLSIASGDIILLTVDLDLYLAASNAGLEAINFNHERERSRPDWQ